MASSGLYVERVARNGAVATDMADGPFRLSGDLVERWGEPALRAGLDELRALLRRLYAEMGRRPEAFGIPPVPDAKVFDTPSRRKVRSPFECPIRLLYVLGQTGELTGSGAATRLEVGHTELDSAAAAFAIHDVPRAAASLREAGLRIAEDPGSARGPSLSVSCACGDVLLPALTEFSRCCRHWERGKLKARQVPHVFLMADFRALARTDTRARTPKLTVADVMPFVPEDRASDVEELTRHLGELGYRADVGMANLLDGECRASFVGDHGKTIFGFTACRGRLDLRLSFRDIGRVLPHMDQCPPALRREALSQRCGKCGGAGCGKHITVEVDGAPHDICCFGIQYVRHWTPTDIPHLERLLTVQDGFYREAPPKGR